MKNLLRVLVLIPCLLFLVNCSKSSKDNNNNQCNQYNQGYGQQPYGQQQYGQQPYGQGQYNQYGSSTYYNPNCNGQYPTGGGGQQQCIGTFWLQGQPVLCQYPQQCSGYTLQVNQGGGSQPTSPGATVRCL